jgi:transcriptional regulator with XRE-family HTH domain
MNSPIASVRALSPFGERLRIWRRRRGLSQLDLALATATSSRHVSFIETGRSRPSAGMVLRLAEALEVPLRERNQLLRAAGLRPHYPEEPLSSVSLAPFRAIVDRLLAQQMPFPAFLMDRRWNVLDANASARRFPGMGDLPRSGVDLFLAPGPYRSMMENFAEVSWHLVAELRRDAADNPEAGIDHVVARAEAALADVPPPKGPPAPAGVVAPILRMNGQRLRLITTVVRFGIAQDITLDELRVELVFPGDQAADRFFRAAAEQV